MRGDGEAKIVRQLQHRGTQPLSFFAFGDDVVHSGSGVADVGCIGIIERRDAARTPPARALRAGDEQAMFDRTASVTPGIALITAGVLLAQLGPVRGLPLYGYAAIACLLVGGIALMPRISRAVFHLLPLPRSPELALALAQLRAAPGQAAVSLAAIVASFSLMAAMAIMVSSFRQSVDDWLGTVLPADVYFRTTHAGDTGLLEPAFVERVRALPQVARIDFLRSGRVILDPARPALVLVARDRAALAFPVVARMSAPPSPSVWVSEAVQDIYGYRPGDTVEFKSIWRGEPHTVLQAINRQIAHYAAHIGQIVFLAKHLRSNEWKTLTIPRGKSEEFKKVAPKAHKP